MLKRANTKKERMLALPEGERRVYTVEELRDLGDRCVWFLSTLTSLYECGGRRKTTRTDGSCTTQCSRVQVHHLSCSEVRSTLPVLVRVAPCTFVDAKSSVCNQQRRERERRKRNGEDNLRTPDEEKANAGGSLSATPSATPMRHAAAKRSRVRSVESSSGNGEVEGLVPLLCLSLLRYD